MAISVWGGPLGFFERFWWYDIVLHAFMSFIGSQLLYILGIRLDVLPDLNVRLPQRHRYLGIVIVTLALGLSVGALLEVWEWTANNWFGATNIIGYADTIGDLVDDFLASLAGGATLLVWAEYGWGTSRRLPARQVERRSVAAGAG